MARVALAVVGLIASLGGAPAQNDTFIPSFWDPNKRLTRPDTSAIHLIRFITADDYFPFNFAQADG